MSAEQLVPLLKDGDVSRQLGCCRTLSAAIRGVVGAAWLTVAKPVQDPETVGVEGEDGS